MKHWKSSAIFLTGVAALWLGASDFARAGIYSLTINGSATSGSLDRNDEQLSDGSYFDQHQFQGRAGQRITIVMTSNAVDTYLILLDPEGKKLAENDDNGNSTNSQLSFVLPTTGTYTVLANTYAAESTGTYSLRATGTAASQSVAAAPKYFCNEDSNSPLTMARSRSGEVYTLIEWSDWSSTHSPLERCQQVSQRFNDLNSRLGRLQLTVGTLNNQPVVCAYSRPEDGPLGRCAANGLVLTAQTRASAGTIIDRLQERFALIAQGSEIAERNDGFVRARQPIKPDIVVGEGDAPYINVGEF